MKKSLLFFIAVLLLFATCKKGEGDALMSVQSRKGRLSGEWRLTSGFINIDSFDPAHATHFGANYTIEGTTIKGIETTLTTIKNVQGPFLLNLEFDKDGKIKIREIAGVNILDASGNWDFTNGIGEDKKKESIVISIEQAASSQTYNHFFNQFSSTFRYKIKELKSKSLVLTCMQILEIDASGATDKINSEFIFSR